jgi:SWI/SNF-related matrix-associated actin-dependent regulator of chromatin subfamily A-like protein 1
MRNNYPGRCNTCQTHVPAQQGEARRIDGRWVVFCAAHGATPATQAAQAVLALVIRVWLSAGRVLCAPVSRLNGSFEKYLAATRAAGAGYSKANNAQICDVVQAAALIEALRGAGFAVDVAPDLITTLQARATQAASDVGAARGRAAEINELLRARGLALRPFQAIGTEWLAPREKALLGDDMGLGKTIQALAAAPVGAPLVVVCPAVAKGVWVREAKRFRPDLMPVAFSGRGTFRWPVAGEMAIVNYDILPHVEDPTTIKTKREPILGRVALERKLTQPLRFGETLWTRVVEAVQAEQAWWKAFTQVWERIGLRAHGDQVLATVPAGCVVIADEAHTLKSSKTSRTARFRSLSKAARGRGGRCWLLTATPILNRAAELWALLQAMDGARETFGSFENYKRLWNAEDGRYGIEWGTPSPEVAARMKGMMLRRIKREVLTELPEKTIRTIEVNGLSPSTVKLCDQALAALESMGVDFAKAVALAAETKNMTPAFETISRARAALATAKLAAAIELADAYEDAGEPVVMFSCTVAVAETLGKREGWAVITGATDPKVRTQIEDAFQAGNLKGVACTIKAGGVAITLTRAANSVFVDEEWTPALNEQAQDRVYRMGQSRGVVITRLVASHALDRRVAELNEQKNEIIEGAINAARIGATEVPATVNYTVDATALAADAAKIAAAQAAVAAPAPAVDEVDDGIEIAVAKECPF